MDLSKLPRMSDTRKAQSERPPASDAPAHPPVAQEVSASQHPAAYPGGRVVAVDAGPSGWVSLIVGILLVLFWPRLWQWLAHELLSTSFAPYLDPAGNTVSYLSTNDFWSDLGIALYAVALILDGIVLIWISTSRPALWTAFGVLVLAIAFNIGYFIYSLAQGLGLPMVSVLAVIFGIFMCHQQWQILKGPRRRYLLVEEA